MTPSPSEISSAISILSALPDLLAREDHELADLRRDVAKAREQKARAEALADKLYRRNVVLESAAQAMKEWLRAEGAVDTLAEVIAALRKVDEMEGKAKS